jgi:hypothetical protein
MRAQVSEGAHMLTGEAAESPRSRSQAEILRGVVQGERWANAALYDALHPVVIRTLQKILRDPAADYDDLVQTTFERIVRTLAHDRATPVSSLFGWAGATRTWRSMRFGEDPGATLVFRRRCESPQHLRIGCRTEPRTPARSPS